MIIVNIKTNGFKSLIDFEIDVNPKLNVFIGSNNVGKSNILKLLNLFFNPREIEEQDFPKNLTYQVKSNNENGKLVPYIEIVFNNISKEYKNQYNEYLVDNKHFIIRAAFKEDGTFKYYAIKNRNNSYVILTHKILPDFIYFADVHQRELNLDFLQSIIPNNKNSRSRFVTYLNQMLKGILEDSIMVSLDRTEESFEITVIDEYGTANGIFDKSSGVQQMVFLAMILAHNLDGDPNRRILALEEPEMNLHAGAQKRLFDIIKNNSRYIQTFATTHSPIFIDKANRESVFHVGRNKQNETIILEGSAGDNWYSLKKDLGISINDNLFLGDINMIVEGGTEKILFPHIITILQNENFINFGNESLNIISAESANNVRYFVEVVTQQSNLSSIVILDNDREGNNAKDKIEKNEILNRATKVFQFTREGFGETEIEDLISDEVLLQAIKNLVGIEISKDDFKKYRTHKHKSEMVKFNQMIKEVEKKSKKSISKIELAAEIKKLVTSSEDVQLLINGFKLLDKHIKSLPSHI